MPWTQPKTLTDNEVYALTAYILALNNIIRRRRCDECGDVAQSEDAQQGRVYQQVSGKTLRARSDPQWRTT